MSSLVVEAEQVARTLRIPLPLTEDDRWTIEQAVMAAQADVEGYLKRPITVRMFTSTGRRRYIRPHYRWPWVLAQTPVMSVVSVTPELDEDGDPTGLYTVVYTAGLDAASDSDLQPIRRYVLVAAVYDPQVQALLRRTDLAASRKVTSLSVDGQSVTYSDVYDTSKAAPGSGAPGAVPTLASLDRWKAGRGAYQRRSTTRLHRRWW